MTTDRYTERDRQRIEDAEQRVAILQHTARRAARRVTRRRARLAREVAQLHADERELARLVGTMQGAAAVVLANGDVIRVNRSDTPTIGDLAAILDDVSYGPIPNG